jgi:ATP/maltotriose-dependent transcriptional regulator MalT
MQDREISEILQLSIETVKKHNKNIYLKLGVRNRTEAVIAGKGLKNSK